MARAKLYKFIIAALVIINVGILIFFLTGRPSHHPPKAGDLVEELGIEGPKRELIIQLEEKHHAEKRKLKETDRELHKELFSKIGTDEDVASIQEKIDVNFSEIERMTYQFFHDVAKHCSAKQLEQLKETIHRAFRQMRKGPKK